MNHDLTGLIPEDHTVRFHQQQNISRLLDLSRSFAHDAGFEWCKNPPVQDDTIILESGHQPNFFPYPGVWKKVFLLDHFRELLDKKGVCGIAFFGFADQNAATAPYLYKNHVPALNKEGAQKIGFTVKGKEKWKRFDTIKKPRPEVWDEEMRKIENLYAGVMSDHPEILESMWKSYERADAFSDLNAFIFSRISGDILGFEVNFFRYSDIQRNQMFSEECTHILRNLDSYTKIFNAVIQKEHLPLRPVVSGEVPFWYHCNCGGKTPLLIDSVGMCRGSCPICKKEHELRFHADFSNFDAYSRNMSLTAVSRNLIFSEALGTHIFISGTGGGLRYGKISDAISPAIGFHKPLTCSWSSKDYYLGTIHRSAMKELQTTFSFAKEDLLDFTLDEHVRRLREKMAAKVAEMETDGTDKKLLRLYRGRHLGSATTVDMVSRVFSAVPSMLDLFMNLSREEILANWHKALRCSVPEEEDSSCSIAQDIVYEGNGLSGYSPDEIPVVYRNLSAIGVKKK